MKHIACSHENAVARAARNNEWPEALAAHVAKCALCREVAEAARWMQALAAPEGHEATSPAPAPLPDVGLVWWRAHLAQNSVESPKIRTVLEWMQLALMAAIPVGVAGWTAWNWYAIEAVAGQLLVDTWPQVGAVAYALASVAPALVTLAALSLIYPIFAGD